MNNKYLSRPAARLTGWQLFCFLITLFMVMGQTAIAQTLLLRYSAGYKGNFILIGNTLGQNLATGVPPPITGTIVTGGTNTTDSSPDVFWRSTPPSQAVASTTITAANARSTAQLTIPAGAVVKKAYLYTAAHSGTLAFPNSVSLQVGSSSPVSLSIGQSFSYFSSPQRWYQAVTEITSIVQANGSGQYTVSGVVSTDIRNTTDDLLFTAWSIVVFYEDSTEPFRRFALNDGFVALSNSSYSGTFSGLRRITGTTKLGIVAYDGDNVETGDELRVNGQIQSNDQNPTNDFFNSTHSISGTAITTVGDLPQLTGAAGSMSGIDLDIIDITNSVSMGASSFSVSMSTSSDFVLLGVLISSVESLPPPSITATASSNTVCRGNSATLSVSASGGTRPYSYTWTAPPGATISSRSTSAISTTITTSGPKVFTVIVSDAGIDFLTSTTTVVVNGISTLSISISPSTTTIQAGQYVTLTTSATNTGETLAYSWSSGESTSAISVSTAGTYSVTATNGCASATASAVVSVTVPAPTLVASASTVCSGSPLNVTATCALGVASFTATPSAGSVSGNVFTLGEAAGVYSLSASCVYSGVSSPVTALANSLTILQTPTVGITPTTTTIIRGNSVALTASGASTYSWNITPANSNTTISVSPTETTVYSVTGISNGCIGTASATVTVGCGDTTPARATSLTQTAGLGQGTCSVTLLGQGYGTSYIVTGPNGYVFSAVYRLPGSHSIQALNVTQPGTYLLTVRTADACGRISSDTRTYVVTGNACQ